MVEDAPREVGGAAQTFASIWEALVDVLGSAAAATLVRRALSEARATAPGLEELAISRVGFEYRYELPPSWKTDASGSANELRALVRHLEPLLRELTGPVVVKRLRALPEVARHQLFQQEVER